MPRKTHAKTFKSMDLNARRRLGLRRQRDDDDQHVLVDHTAAVDWSALTALTKLLEYEIVLEFSNLQRCTCKYFELLNLVFKRSNFNLLI